VWAGGISGTNNGQIIGCWTDLTMNINASNTVYVYSIGAGIVGLSTQGSIIRNCYSMGSITVNVPNDGAYAGGIAGYHVGDNGLIANCWSTTLVKSISTSSARSGGIVAISSNASALVTDCAALNPGLICEGNMVFGRVAASNTGILTNNIAFDEMAHPQENGTWENIGANQLDGADINKLEINLDGALGDLFTAGNGWVIENGKLPGIGQPVEMPPHLALYFITTEANPEEGGEVSGDGIFDYGENAIVTAFANDGYYFVNWTEGDVHVSTDEEYTFEVTSSRNLVANFEPIIIYYTVTVIAGTGGTVEIVGYDTLSELIEEGTSVTVKATANAPTYDFIEWTDTVTGETISSLPVYSFTVSEDVTLVAHFESVGINEIGISGYTIYPNPAENELRIRNSWQSQATNPSDELGIEGIEIYDVFGRNVVGAYRIRPLTDRPLTDRPLTDRPLTDSQNEIVIDISNLPAGVYMIRIIESGRDAARHVSTQRFVKK